MYLLILSNILQTNKSISTPRKIKVLRATVMVTQSPDCLSCYARPRSVRRTCATLILVVSIYEHNGSGGPVPDRYCRFPNRRAAVCAPRIMMRARNDGCGPLPVTP